MIKILFHIIKALMILLFIVYFGLLVMRNYGSPEKKHYRMLKITVKMSPKASRKMSRYSSSTQQLLRRVQFPRPRAVRARWRIVG